MAVIFLSFLLILGLIGGDDRIKPTQMGEFQMHMDYPRWVSTPVVFKPHTEILNERIIKQEFDYSCGSAALATLLRYYLGEALTERQVIHGLLRYGDSEQIAERRAFSLLDMKKFVKVLGYKGIGYKAEIEDLKELEGPCVLPIKLFGFRHFTVFKGIYKGHVFLADPFKGHNSYTLPEFKKFWYQNVIFVVYPEGAKELSALQLQEADLRFIDEDTTFQLMFPPEVSTGLPDWKIVDIPGTQQTFKHRW
jgi:uncharacterized protein